MKSNRNSFFFGSFLLAAGPRDEIEGNLPKGGAVLSEFFFLDFFLVLASTGHPQRKKKVFCVLPPKKKDDTNNSIPRLPASAGRRNRFHDDGDHHRKESASDGEKEDGGKRRHLFSVLKTRKTKDKTKENGLNFTFNIRAEDGRFQNILRWQGVPKPKKRTGLRVGSRYRVVT